MASNSLIVITGSGLRHRYFADRIHSRFPVSKVMIDHKLYPEPPYESEEEQSAWDWFFERRRSYEEEHFTLSENQSFPAYQEINLPAKGINSIQCIEELSKDEPGFVAVFGTDLIQKENLDYFGPNLFNLHLGLSHLHRGSSCNFWPIYEKQPQTLGASIIKINPGIDTGEIYAQSTIQCSRDDSAQSLMGKTVLLGTELMLKTIESWEQGTLTPLSIPTNGRLHLIKEFTPKAVLKVKQMQESGELKQLLKSGG